MSRDEATQAQVRAADPSGSTWLSANAGSGKTRVLTDRVARLLLEGTDPQQILCLTYTKAAASEMQNRLFQRLGEWAMCADEPLRAALLELGHEGVFADDDLARARTLFARAIETPGGLKIQTIHSFCASLLRRFPLEAGVNPQFQEIEERAAELLREDIVEEMASGEEAGLVSALTTRFTGESFAGLTQEIVRHQSGFGKDRSLETIYASFGLPAGYNADDIERELFIGGEADLITRVIAAMKESNKTDQGIAAKLAAVGEMGMGTYPRLADILLTADGGARKTVPGKPVEKAAPEDHAAMKAFMQRIEDASVAFKTLEAAQETNVLNQFATRFLAHYAKAKQLRGWLDFDDLILRTRGLLQDERVAAWVLYRLDGGISHILVDEAQDTSPAQWDVIRLLAQEFTSGQGARGDMRRTIFVVGDKKQSIYSFQGADPDEFDRMQDEFEEKLHAVEERFRRATLEFSFRSANAILRTVDLTFDGRAEAGFVPDQKHRAFHQDKPGRVDLWPVIKASKSEDDSNWTDPVDRKSDTHHMIILARAVADHIAGLLAPGSSARIPFQKDRGGPFFLRRITAEDIMILVQRRSALFHEIIRACKQRDLPIAGADRLRVGAELAVRDLLALLSFLVTPEDSLSLATILRSPLFGWSEKELFDLAHTREGPYLWEALREKADTHPKTLAMLLDLRDRIDFLRPYELLERILTRHKGRDRLLARLGTEAEDGIDALLSQALSYERSEIPSLTGFLTWAQADDLEIKRQIDSNSDQIRVMTVHGSKGLEAPIVILPDCGQRKLTIRDEILATEGGAIWKTSGKVRPDAIETAIQSRKDAEIRERQRLLYVAMTRAETWLTVAAAGELGKDGSDWHSTVAAGLEAAGAIPVTTPMGEMKRFETGDWALPEAEQPPAKSRQLPLLENIYSETVANPQKREEPISPSNLGGAKALPSELGYDEATATARGTYLHLLLEQLAGTDMNEWPARAGSVPADALLPEALVTAAQEEVFGVLRDETLAWIFDGSALAEVPIHGTLFGRALHGVIDRLIVTDEHVTAIDFKSNAAVPITAETCPESLLRQMGAYADALRHIYPEREIRTGILWTANRTYMQLPQNLVNEALARATLLDVIEAAT